MKHHKEALVISACALISFFIKDIYSFFNSNKELLNAFSTVIMALFTIALWRSSVVQAKATQDSIKVAESSANAAAESNKLSKDIFLSSERPWIQVDINVAGPLTYTSDGIQMKVIFNLKNLGKSPARNVIVSPELFITDFFRNSHHWGAHTKKYKENKGTKTNDAHIGSSIFPEETIQQPYIITLSQEQIDSALNPVDVAFPSIKSLFLHIIGYVQYSFVFDDLNHHTGFIWNVKRAATPRATVPPNHALDAIWVSEGDVPAQDIRLFQDPAGFYTD